MKYLICNLKAHKTYSEILEFKDYICNINTKNTEFILAPSNIYLSLFKNTNINLCCQNLDLNESLNLTGDTSISQLKSLNVKYTIIGHPERRKYYHETEQEILSKIKIALANNIKVIYCIGETLEEKMRKVTYQVLEKSLARILNHLSQKEFQNIIIAYEPPYLIGGNIPIDYSQISETINFIKTLINDYYGYNLPIVYGGNVNPSNIKHFKKIKNLDGYIVAKTILNPLNIKSLIDNIN